ncbi:MAG: Integron integrase IntIPac [Burkholderiaceae bacterium]|jgi:integrase|nr:MAG: Integron integrase IntIPac [Burkholderiaceae bacterium]
MEPHPLPPSAAPAPQLPRLLERIRTDLRTRHDSTRNEATYVDRARRFILFHGKRHAQDIGAMEVEALLGHPVVDRQVGHADVNTTMIYTHVLNRGGRGILSPLDAL